MFTVNHRILSNRLKEIGLSGIVLRWFESYLCHRSQEVCIHDAHSASVSIDFSVPQGSVLGPQLFNIYTLPIQYIVQRHSVSYHMYADDLQLYFTCRPVQTEIDENVQKLENCIADIRNWMIESHLKLNDAKTEFILLGNRIQLSKVHISHVQVGSARVTSVHQAKNLGVLFDSAMSLESHVSNCVKLANCNLRNIRTIRQYLSPQSTQQLVHAFVTSHLDNCNSLLFRLPANQVNRLQKVQNTAARLVTKSRRSSRITPILKSLHWLPVQQRVIYKILLLTYRAQNNLAPDYISSLLLTHSSGRSGLRSSNNVRLKEIRTKRSWGDRAFSSAAPFLWNRLPLSIQTANTLSTFKAALKTHLMLNAYC